MSATTARDPTGPATALAVARRDDQHGFSLLELVIATLVLSVVLLYVTLGLREAGRQLGEAQRTVTRGSTDLAFALLRRDARSSRHLPLGGGWSRSPLVLALPDGSRVAYVLEQDRLERLVLDAANRPESAQTLARSVLSFRWRALAPALLETEIALRPPRRPPRVLDRSAVRPRDPPLFERVTVALRSRPRQEW